MRFLRAALVGLLLGLPIAAADAIPTVATVGYGCKTTWYYRNGGYAYKMFSTCPAGTTYYAQRAHLNCTTGQAFGIWQTQPGPWYGSTATCPGNGYALSASVEFW